MCNGTIVPYTLLSGATPIWNQSTTGNANTATKLASSKLINGVAFDGTVDITIASVSANALTFTNTGTGNIAGSSFDGSLAKTISYNSIGALGSNPSITGATKTKLTYDAKGLVTAGADATTADIMASTNKNYLTDAQAAILANTSGTNTGDQTFPTLETLRRSENELDPFFDESGILSKLTLSSNSLEKQTEEIDLSKSIHKLVGMNKSNYILKDGFEGQVIYILPFGDKTNLSDVTIRIDNATIWISNELITSNKDKPIIWTPFSDSSPSITMAMAIFTENKWFITGGTSILK